MSKLRCARDTVGALNSQVTERDQEFAQAKLNWDKKEEELHKRIEKLAIDNERIKEKFEAQTRELKEMKENYTTMLKLYENEESKSKKSSKIILELQNKVDSLQNSGLRPSTPKRPRGNLTYRATEGPELLKSVNNEAAVFMPAEELKLSKKEENNVQNNLAALAPGSTKNATRQTMGIPKIPLVKPVAKSGIKQGQSNNLFL